MTILQYPWLKAYLERWNKTSIPKGPWLVPCLTVSKSALSSITSLARSKKSHEQIADLADAIHNMPTLLNDFEKCDMGGLRRDLRVYDEKWFNNPDDFSLIKQLELEFRLFHRVLPASIGWSQNSEKIVR